MIATALFAAFVARLVVGDWQITDAIVPVAMIAAFPFFEWVIHKGASATGGHAASVALRPIRWWRESIACIMSIRAIGR